MSTVDLPVWAAIPAALLLIIGGSLALIGAIGLLKLPTFYMRLHSPSMGNTLGAGCVLIASMLVSSALLHRPVIHEVLITLFMVMTAPISAMLIMRGAIHRTRVNEERQRRQTDSMP